MPSFTENTFVHEYGTKGASLLLRGAVHHTGGKTAPFVCQLLTKMADSLEAFFIRDETISSLDYMGRCLLDVANSHPWEEDMQDTLRGLAYDVDALCVSYGFRSRLTDMERRVFNPR